MQPLSPAAALAVGRGMMAAGGGGEARHGHQGSGRRVERKEDWEGGAGGWPPSARVPRDKKRMHGPKMGGGG